MREDKLLSDEEAMRLQVAAEKGFGYGSQITGNCTAGVLALLEDRQARIERERELIETLEQVLCACTDRCSHLSESSKLVVHSLLASLREEPQPQEVEL